MTDQQGFTLLELLLGLLISMLLALAITHFFSQSNRSYLLNESRSQVQERGRFAINLLTRDLRSSMSWGCLGRETDAVTSHLINDVLTTPSVQSRIFDADDVALPSSVRSQAVSGTQVLKVAGFADYGLRVNQHRGPEAEVEVVNTRAAEFLSVGRGDYLLLIDAQCSQGHLVQAAADVEVPENGAFTLDYSHAAGLQPGNKDEHLPVDYGETFADFGNNSDYAGRVNLFRSAYYFLGEHQGRRYLTVYRPEAGQAVLLVPGIEAMHLTAGIGEIGKLDGYFNTDEVSDWNRIRSVRIDFLITSDKNSAPGQKLRRFFWGQAYQFENQYADIFSTVIGIRVMNP